MRPNGSARRKIGNKVTSLVREPFIGQVSSTAKHAIPRPAPSTATISDKLPVELWTEIFTLATIIPGKDEFSVDGAVYNVMVCEGPVIASSPSFEEISEMNKARLQLIKTCKYWRLIATPLLWSHLRVNVSGSQTVINSMCTALVSKPELASYIRRLDIIFPFDQRSCPSFIPEKIFGQPLPSLKIFTCPFSLHPVVANCQPDVVVLETADFAISQFKPQNSVWNNVRILHVHFIATLCFSEQPEVVHFTRLENFYVKDKGSNISWYLVKYWEVPSLRILSIDSSDRENSAYWVSWLTKVASRLEKLQLSIRADVDRSEVILMPRLRVLYISFNYHGWIPVKAPLLHRAGYYDIQWLSSVYLNRRAKILVELFPTIVYLVFRWCTRALPTSLPNEYLEEQVQYWLEQGIQLDVG